MELAANYQVCVDDRAMLDGHAAGLEVGFDHLGDLMAQIMDIQQISERQKHGLIKDPSDHS